MHICLAGARSNSRADKQFEMDSNGFGSIPAASRNVAHTNNTLQKEVRLPPEIIAYRDLKLHRQYCSYT